MALKMTLVIVPCGKSKIWDRKPGIGPTPARDAYTGNPFKLNREYAEVVGGKWIILSAKYGFIQPEFRIENYNVTFNKKSSMPVSMSTLQAQIHANRLWDFDMIVVLGGKQYRTVVEKAFSGLSVTLQFPFSGLPLGKAMQTIRMALEALR